MIVETQELDAVVRREHADPHSVLGAHSVDDGVVVRAYRPAARAVSAHLRDGFTVELEQIHPGGVFEGVIEGAELPLRYRLEVQYEGANSFTIDDPYAFGPTIGELDLHLIGEGRHEEIYEKLGAHVRQHDGIRGTAFAVWAPAARAVSVVGDFNSWDGRLHACARLARTGSGSCSSPASSRAPVTSTRS
jgi:1,4-alpha-glucan branching enzyme